MEPGVECNSMALNILYILYPENNKIKIIKDNIINCNNLYETRKLMKMYGRITDWVVASGYKEVTGRLLPGDFLIKQRKYFDDVIYKIDANTYCGIAPLSQFNKKHGFIISDKMHITTEHKIYRKG